MVVHSVLATSSVMLMVGLLGVSMCNLGVFSAGLYGQYMVMDEVVAWWSCKAWHCMGGLVISTEVVLGLVHPGL
jgi:hypothetical protein